MVVDRKKIMILGGSRYILPVIREAHRMGIYVITCDYLPDNIAHSYSDEYCNISILDKEHVLRKAHELQIDGIMSFACDPGVVTAAYVAEKMGLPSVGSYGAVSILQDKGLFRGFLAKNGFNVPNARRYNNKKDPMGDVNFFNWPVIVKPTDSAGSKGVTKVVSPSELNNAIEIAISESHNGAFIIEDFLEQDGYASDCDCFSIDGKLEFCSFSSQRFDGSAKNPYTPAAFSWPSEMDDGDQNILRQEIQRLIKLLGLRTSIYNIETRKCVNGKCYIMECSPRGGGNRLSEMIKFGTGVDLIRGSVEAALGMTINNIQQKDFEGFWGEVILHSDRNGKYKGLELDKYITNNVIERDLWVKMDDEVERFSAANKAIGTLVMRFDSKEALDRVLSNPKKYISVKVEGKDR